MTQSTTVSQNLRMHSSQELTEVLSADCTGDQAKAFYSIVEFLTLDGGGFFVLSGYAGTGKTYLMGKVLQYIQQSSEKRVALTAPTHKALKILMQFTQADDLFTTHAYLGMREDIDRSGNRVFVPGNGYNVPSDNYHIVIVDEASMVDDVIFDELENLVRAGRKVLFVGDPLQIPPVNQKNSLPFESYVQKELSIPVANLTEIVRQAADNPIIETSMQVRGSIFRPVLALSYESNTNGLMGVTYAPKGAQTEVIDSILDMFASDSSKADPDYVKILAWTNKTVDHYNNLVRAFLFGHHLPRVIVGDKLVANAPIKEGKQILVRNNEDMEVMEVNLSDDVVGPEVNFKVYKIKVMVFGLAGESRECIIKILHEDAEKDFKKTLNLLREIAKMEKRGTFKAKSAWMDYYKFKERYADVKYAYAITCHKSQGSTYDHAVLMLYDLMHNRKVEERNRILYTAITRPKYTLKIIH